MLDFHFKELEAANRVLSRRQNPFHMTSSPAISKVVDRKRKKYAPLLALVLDSQRASGRRRDSAILLVPAISRTGEMSADFFRIIESLCMAYKHSYRPGSDDISCARYTSKYRNELKDRIAATLAKSTGTMLRCGTFPLRRGL